MTVSEVHQLEVLLAATPLAKTRTDTMIPEV
jgi:hypothetical protein